ncbi:MAG TPA: DNA internalization-related competence protein ComEC/Rec2, partial [Thermoanaerobaculia bacterium]|nr:DNA internalization-related competence protein ComEC/Rec2 [Thermoanaerobaculia bacterium]
MPDGWAARPAVLPAVALLASTWFGLRAVFLPLPLAALLAAAGVALGGRKGGAVAAFAAGLVAAAVAGAPHPLDLAPSDRPLAVTARVAEHPRPSDDGWSMRLAVERVAHRGRVWTAAGDDLLWLTLPGDEAPPPLGSRLRLRGRPSRSPGFANRLPPPPGPWRMRVKSRRLLEVEAEPGPWAARAGRWRQRVEAAVDEASAGRASPGVALTRALVLGDAGGVPERWRRGLRRSGLAHLLAVSGLHVALVAAVALGLAWPVPLRWRWLAALPAVALYVAVAGPRPALLRAALMGTIAAVALLAGRPASGGNALAVAAALLALTRPALVDDLGFRLTVAATGGLVFLAPPAAAALRRAADAARERLPPHLAIRLFVALPLRLLRALARPLTASVAAQVASAPFALPAFHLLSFGSPLTNLVAVPWTALFLAAALAWCALAVVSPTAAGEWLPWLDALAAPFGWPAQGPPVAWGALPVVAPPLATAAAALFAALWLRRPRRGWALLAALALLPVVRWGYPPAAPALPGGATVTALDVGQGDALLLQHGGRAVLVDGGGWRRGDLGGRVLLPALLGAGVERLDAAVVTHPDVDHCRGLADLASYLPVAEVWIADGWQGEACVGELVAAAIPGRPSRLRRLAAGDEVAVGGWRFQVLHPPPSPPEPGRLLRLAQTRNDRSLVLAAEALGRRVLLTGDVEARAERLLLREGAGELPAFALKVAHHGSKSSSGERFLAAVAPRVALVSAGRRNPYGHPAPVVVERLERAGAVVLRTDRMGA